MKQTVKHLAILFILNLILVFQVKAQIYPVQFNMQLQPPYSLRLSDYVTPGTNRIGLNMLLADLNKPDYYIRLELLIEGDGITIRTKPTFNPGPIILEGGVPQYFTSSDLAEWFDPQNLDFSGYSKSAYAATGRLPEGVYRFSFRAYDYNKNVRVSNSPTITAWLLLNDPPVINLPLPDYKVEYIDPQNIVFQWTPRHTGSPNSAFSTEYEFILVEIWPEGRNPNDAILSGIPIYQTTTTNTTLVYGLSEPFLEPGRQYAYRVQARDADERDMFKNKGYSEVRKFTFGDECKPVNQIKAKAEKYYEAEISWQASFNQNAFNVRYRKANDPNAEWFDEETSLDYLKIKNLQELTTYEYQVMAYCGTYEGDYSDIQTFTTPAPEVAKFDCGTGDDASNIANQDPLPELNEDDYIWSGNFKFRITEATGSNGTFSGKASGLVPYMNFINLACEFKNIKINTDNQVYQGEIKSIYNPDSPFILGITIGDGNHNTNGSTTDTTNTAISDTTFTTEIDSVYIDGDVIIVVNEDGTTDTIPSTEDIVITDSNGDTWTVEDGEVIVGGGTETGGEDLEDGTSTDESEEDIYYIKIDDDDKEYKNKEEIVFVKHKDKVPLKLHSKDSLDINKLVWNIDGKEVITGSDIYNLSINSKGKQDLEIFLDKEKILSIKISVYKKPTIEFERGSSYNGEYGFDDAAIQSFRTEGDYEMINIDGNNYYVPFITLLSNQTTEIIINTRNLASKAKKDNKFKVTFKANSNILDLNFEGKETTYYYDDLKNKTSLFISVRNPGNADLNTPYEIIAEDNKGDVIGKIAVIAGNPFITKRIMFIYVNHGSGYSSKDVNDILNFLNLKSYNQAFRKWELAIEKGGIDSLDITSNYKANTSSYELNTTVVDSLVETYKVGNTISNNNYYVFITNLSVNNSSGQQIAGRVYQRIGSNIAVVFSGSKESTYTHELGHNLGLYHTFSDSENAPRKITKGTTTNFMDYSITRNMFFIFQIKKMK